MSASQGCRTWASLFKKTEKHWTQAVSAAAKRTFLLLCGERVLFAGIYQQVLFTSVLSFPVQICSCPITAAVPQPVSRPGSRGTS